MSNFKVNVAGIDTDMTADQIAKLKGDIETQAKTGFVPAHPDTTMTFDEYISGFPSWRRSGWVFGSGVAGADGAKDAQGRTIIKSHAVLQQHFEAQGATVNGVGYESNPGNGYDLCARGFGPQAAQPGSALAGAPSVHVFEADNLRLQPVVQYGSAQIYLTTQVAAAGITVNSRTTNVETPIANFGAAAGDLASISVGHTFTIGSNRFFVKAKSGAGLTVEGASIIDFTYPEDGATYTYAPNATQSNWAVQFSSLCVARVAAGTSIAHGTKGPYAMATPIPADIVPGCVVKWNPHPNANFSTVGHLRIESIDRTGANHTFTLDQNIVNNPYNGSMTGGSLVFFGPCIWTCQMASLESQGPLDCGIYAAKFRVTMPDCETTPVNDNTYGASGINAWLTARPKAKKSLGWWYAFWFNKTDMSADRTTAWIGNFRLYNRRDELDKPGEFFHRLLGGGGNVWSGNTHQRGTHRTRGDNYLPSFGGMASALGQLMAAVTDVNARTALIEWFTNFFSASRTRVVNAARTGWRLAGSKWIEQSAGYPSYQTGNSGGVMATDGAHLLELPDAYRVFKGVSVDLAVVWTRSWSVCYLHGEPICVTHWNITDQEQPYALIVDLLLHTTDGWASGAGFLARDTANAADNYIKIHSIDVWRGA